MKNLYIVKKFLKNGECEMFTYVVSAKSLENAVDIVRNKTKETCAYTVELANNSIVWE